MSGGVTFELDDGGRIFLSSLEHVVVSRDHYDYLVKYFEWRTGEPLEPASKLKHRIMAHLWLRKPLK